MEPWAGSANRLAARASSLQELSAEAGDGGSTPPLLSQATLERALMARLR